MLWRAFLHVAEADRAQARNELGRFLQRQVAVSHPAARLYQAGCRLDELLERLVPLR